MEHLVTQTNMPMVLHGGTGLNTEVYERLIALGAAKVNISTHLKKTYADGFRTYLEKNPTQYDPLKLIGAVQNDVTEMAKQFLKTFGSAGQA
jgi:fructose-bisphosphate aldolase class II